MLRPACGYLALQGAAVVTWWVVLLSSEAFRGLPLCVRDARGGHGLR